MNVRRATLGFVLLAAATAGAAETGGAPLEGAKQELKALQADQTARNSAAAPGKITEGLPQVSSPMPGEIPLDLNSSIKMEKELKKKKDAQKNWLLDGMDQLGQNAKTGKDAHGKETAGDVPTAEEDKPDSSDPNYLLKLYSEQKKNDEAKTEARKPAASRNDPMAPFLQGWMGIAPSGGKLADESGRKPEAGAAGAGPGWPVTGPMAGSQSQSASNVPDYSGTSSRAQAVTQTNPYLPVPEMTALPDTGPSRNQSSGPDSVLGGPVATPLAAALTDPIPAGRPAGKKPQMLHPSDNDKYFPQQKKF